MIWEYDNPVAFSDLARMLKNMRCKMSVNGVIRVVLNILDNVDAVIDDGDE